MNHRFASLLCACLVAVAACSSDDVGDGRDDPFASGNKGDSAVEPGSAEALAVLALVNDSSIDVETLDDAAGLTHTAADGIIGHRNGPDGEFGTEDDDLFDDLAELDAIPYVGPRALSALLDYAVANGFLGSLSPNVIFSPQPTATSHNKRLVELIDSATETIDVAIYSFSESGISAALEAAVARGVNVRFIFETANTTDRKLSGTALDNSKSGRLERAGIDVRYVNKVMHHKFLIVDGPRHDIAKASTAAIASGSANWNAGAARFDENTLFLTGNAKATLLMQREFNLMWDNSKDLVVEDFPVETASLEIGDDDVPDDPTFDVYFSSANFTPFNSSFRVTSRDNVSSKLVAAIESAERSILIASGHLRLRPVAEALMAKAQNSPDMDIRVYLDGQEYISAASNQAQEQDLEECLANATSDTQRRTCLVRGFLFGYEVGETEGIDVRYKYYAYRWDHSYAEQMHHKYMIVDGEELYTGSYNYSDNAEHDTFENVFVFRGSSHQELINAFTANFEKIWETGGSEDLLSNLEAEVTSGNRFPIVFPPMAVSQKQISDLKSDMAAACPAVNSIEYRSNAGAHRFCDPND